MERRHITVEARRAGRWVQLSGKPLGVAEARELETLFAELAEQPDVRVVVLGSAGPDFCPGAADDLDPLTSGVDPVAAIAAFPRPVVVSMPGHTGSVGLEIALAGDIRLALADSTFAITEPGSTRLPCWGGTQRLPRLAGRSTAALMLLAAHQLDVGAARRCGLIYRSADSPDALDAAVDDLAGQIEALAPLALAAAKEALATGPELPMRQALELEGDLNHLLQTTADRAEGLSAFFEKRSANFGGT